MKTKPDINKIKVIDADRGYFECANYCGICKNVFGSCEMLEKRMKQGNNRYNLNSESTKQNHT